MARENPPTAPAAIAQKMLIRSGNGPPCASAISDINTKAQAWENAVRTKAWARREPYPPAKSDAPQMNTAATEYAAGGRWTGDITPDERNTEKHLHRLHARLKSINRFNDGSFRGRGVRATRARVLKFPQ